MGGFTQATYLNDTNQVLVASPTDVTGTLYTAETDAQSTTRTKIDIPLGARVIAIDVSSIASATAKFLWVTFDAINDTAADTALASSTTRLRIPVGRTFEIAFDSLSKCTRVDYRTDGNGATPTCDVSIRWVL